MTQIRQYMARGHGGRAVGMDVGGLRVLVEPQDADENEAALQLAERIVNKEEARVALEFKLAAAQNDAAALRDTVRRLEARLSEAQRVNEAAIAGRRRFFGPVLMCPVASDWSGDVWLLDPEKMDRGSGLRFASVAEVRALHPELWVVAVTADGVLLDAWGGAA